jgi:hypothetical protein
MKIIQNSSALILAIVLSCNSNDTIDSMGKGLLNCTIDGKSFKATIANASVENNLSDGTLQIVGLNGNDGIEILLDNDLAVTGANLSGEGGVMFNNISYAILPEKPAKVSIIKRTDTHVTGTFSFIAEKDIINPGQGVTVSQGSFDVDIVE